MKESRIRIELASGQKLQSEKRMRRPTDSEVDLEGEYFPRLRPRRTADEEIHAEPAHDAACRKRLADPPPRLRNLPPIAFLRGEPAAEIHLCRQSAQELVVRGNENDPSVRIDPELAARRARLLSFQKLLDDPAHRPDLFQVRGGGLRGNRKRHPAQRVGKRRPTVLLRKVKEGVAFARKTLLQLDDGFADSRSLFSQRLESLDDVELRAQILESFRKRNARFAEDLAAPGLRSEVLQIRIDSVQRNSEQHREPALERRRVEDGQESASRVADAVSDPLDQTRTLEDLFGQRAGRGVLRAQKRQARARVARRDPGQQLEVVVEDQRMDRLRRDVDHVCLRVAESNQQEEEPLFVEARAFELLELPLVESHRGHDHGGIRLLFLRGECVPELVQPRLELPEQGELAFGRKVAGKRGFRDHAGVLGIGVLLSLPGKNIGNRYGRTGTARRPRTDPAAMRWAGLLG